MKKTGLVSVVLFTLFISATANAQKSEVIQRYIDQYKDLAISEMQRTGVPAAIKLAQGIHETSAGTSTLVQKSNNHFGIKCKSNWTGESVSHDDDARGECFRKYPVSEDSYKDHSNFLRANQRYSFLFELEPTDYTGWANGLKKAGYATNPKYPLVLIKLIEDYHLQDYTMIALGRMEPKKEEEVAYVSEEQIKMEKNKSAEVIQQQKSLKPTPSYPEGEFKINDTKVVWITAGTSFLGVAKQYNISLSRLFEFNELKEAEVAEKDQLIYLQRKRKSGKDDYHVVMPGESLHDIAQEQGIRLESLMEYNWLRFGQEPAVGERLTLRGKSNVMPKLALKDNYSIDLPNSRRLN